MKGEIFKSVQHIPDTITLQKPISSVEEIDIENEKEFTRFHDGFHSEYCVRRLVANKLSGLYEVNCQGQSCFLTGTVLLIELLDTTHLKVTTLSLEEEYDLWPT